MKPPKRKAIPLRVQLDAALIQLGLDPKAVELHHQPSLGLRPYYDGVYVPDQHDSEHLVWMAKEPHRKRTHGRKGESKLSIGGGDQQAIAKTKRLEVSQAAFREAALRKDGGEVGPPPRSSWGKGRGFGTQHRPLQSRNNLKRRQP
jgi:hypothetical protein